MAMRTPRDVCSHLSRPSNSSSIPLLLCLEMVLLATRNGPQQSAQRTFAHIIPANLFPEPGSRCLGAAGAGFFAVRGARSDADRLCSGGNPCYAGGTWKLRRFKPTG